MDAPDHLTGLLDRLKLTACVTSSTASSTKPDIYRTGFRDWQIGAAAAVAVVRFCVMFVFSMLQLWLGRAEDGAMATKSTRSAFADHLLVALTIGLAALWMLPVVWVVAMSLKPNAELMRSTAGFLPIPFTPANYINLLSWARTGHLPVRRSLIDSNDFKALPHRAEYANTASIADAFPPIQNQRGIQDAMVSGLSAIWLTGEDPKAALAGLQSSVDRVLKRSH